MYITLKIPFPLKSNHIHVREWPSQSPDPNIIKDLKQNLQKHQLFYKENEVIYQFVGNGRLVKTNKKKS